MSDDSKEWRWVGEDGAQTTLSEQELIAELSSESLPHYTLVWKKGWAEWLPAMQVVELAWSLPPGKADDPAAPKEKASADSPPAPPLYRYPVIKRRAQNLKSDKPPPDRPLKIGRPESLRPAAAKAARPAAAKVEIPKAASVPRIEEEPLPAEAKEAPALAPEASEPTRPRAEEPPSVPMLEDDVLESVPAPADVEPDEEIHEVEADLEESRPYASPEPLAAAPDPVGAYAYGDEDNAETRVLPGRALPTGEATYVAPHAPPPPAPAEDAVPMAQRVTSRPPPADESMADLPRLPPPPPAPAGFSEYAQAPRTGPPPYVYGLIAVIVLLAAGMLFMASGDEPSVAPAPSSLAPSAAASPSTAPAEAEQRNRAPCVVSRAAVKLAPAAFPGVQPNFAPVPSSERLAIGFADGKNAFGMTLDPKSLDRDHVFQQSKRSRVVSATPTTRGDRLAFQVVREKDDLSPASVVNVATPFAIGLYKSAVARVDVDSDAKPSSVWEDVGDSITTPRLATIDGTGHAMTFRVGGKDGSIRAGWLTREGARLSGLAAVKTDAEFVGTPDVGGGDAGALVAFAARRPGQTHWGLQTARMTRGSEPQAAKWFEIPEGGPGESAISPLVAGLGGKRWLLAWTEGSAGGRAVRLQILDESTEPLGPATRVSPESTNAGQGAIWVRGQDAVVLFFVEGDDAHELWGASVHCPAAD